MKKILTLLLTLFNIVNCSDINQNNILIPKTGYICITSDVASYVGSDDDFVSDFFCIKLKPKDLLVDVLVWDNSNENWQKISFDESPDNHFPASLPLKLLMKDDNSYHSENDSIIIKTKFGLINLICNQKKHSNDKFENVLKKVSEQIKKKNINYTNWDRNLLEKHGVSLQ